MQIILASKSPRRKDILEKIGVKFNIDTCDTDETLEKILSPDRAVMEIARRKAKAVAEKHVGEDTLIIGADTVVVHDGNIIGKPKNEADAIDILRRLSADTHAVYTGFCLIYGEKCICSHEVTWVKFRELCHDEIISYVATGEPMDKAGGYGIQQRGSLFVEKIEGDYYNVVGFPIAKIFVTLREKFGINLL